MKIKLEMSNGKEIIYKTKSDCDIKYLADSIIHCKSICVDDVTVVTENICTISEVKDDNIDAKCEGGENDK